MMNESAVVLLSSGLDSAANLVLAAEQHPVALALTFDYGQRAADAEIRQSKVIAQKYKVPHQVIELPFFKQFTKTSLVNTGVEIPTGEDVQINDLNQSEVTKNKVWVPNRNGIMLSIAAGFAEGLGASFVVPGYNKEEAATFPDNSEEFLTATDHSFRYSTQNQVKTKCFTVQMNKTEIVAELAKRKFEFNLLWPCYFSGDSICGQCESCQRFSRALHANGVSI